MCTFAEKDSITKKYESPCLAVCVTYIIATDGYDIYLEIKEFIKEHLISFKEFYYDKYYKQYDKIYVKVDKESEDE